MKRLILMGGRPWLADDKGERFVDTLFRYSKTYIQLAFCMFAQPEADWKETQNTNITMFERFKNKRVLSFQTMTAENFKEVSKWADIVYIPGGDPFMLLEKIKVAGDVGKIWDGKVIAGSSAGADLFCSGFTYLQNKTVGHGLSWVSATCMPHWRSNFQDYSDTDWDWAEQELLREFPDLPVLCIPESDFVELTVK